MSVSINQNNLFITACDYADKGRYSESLGIFNKLENLFPNEAALHFLMGMCEFKLQKLSNSRSRLEKCLQINPRLSKANHLLGNVLRDMQEFDLAIDSYKKEISLNSDYPDVLNDMGILYFMVDKYDEALEAYDKAIKIDNRYADPYQNKAMIYFWQKQFNEAKKLLELAIKLKASNYEAVSMLANLKTHTCDFEVAWKLYKYRFELELKDEKLFFEKPVWTDQLVKNKKIYLYAEQGIGDQILFGTMFREAFETPNKFIVSIDQRLIPIFNRSFSQCENVRFVSKSEKVSESLFDLQLAIGDLGKFFRRSVKDFEKFSYPYLFAKNKKIELIEQTVKDNKKIICGISWRSASNKIGLDKSIALEDFKQILNIKDFLFVDLQYGDTLAERKYLKSEYDIVLAKIEDIDNFNDIDGLASLINVCDMVITSSNVTAHIAGALNKKTYLIAPYSKGRCWYWHDGLKQSLWYPSIEIFTQSKNADWLEAIKDIHQKIVSELSV